ncbi:universal stress protein [Streptomyces sp. NBC_00638]|uniref:universal stress protein n=1 Tax=Streptomyces sp. NBC_00638 TaxID=2975794 RepID=UPI0022516C80|nr:universal stress protein [Streptomyces sp. NBC_00638]MCX5001578.1 universal stress protein [Streptomyces sp. NBC_00638]
MTHPITVGVDGSPESRAALAWAGREAVRRGVPLRVVYAWHWPPHDMVGGGDREEQALGAREMTEDAARSVTDRHGDLQVTADVLDGDAVETLLVAAAESGTLVLGSRGYGAFIGFLLGSVGQRVISEAPCPVVLVRAEDRPEAEAGGREIVVGQQGGPEDGAAGLRFAFETAAARGATVRAVRAWSLPPVFAYSPGSLKLLDEAGGLEPYEKKALAEALQPWRERFPGVPVVEHVEMGSAGQVLLSLSGQAQLMIVGRRAERSAVGVRIGSVAHAVIHHAPCPVAVVPHS